MATTLTSLFALFVSGFIVMLANGLTYILVPSRLNAEAVPADGIGLIMSMFSVGFLLGGVLSHRLIIRVGHIRVYAASAAVASMAMLVCYLWMNVWLWALMRVFVGFSIAATMIVSDGWLSEIATNKTRSRILAINQIVLLSAMFFGSLLVNLAAVDSATLYILTGLLFCAGVVPIAISRLDAPMVNDQPSMSVISLFGVSPLGVISVFACGVMLSILLSMLVVYAESQGIVGFDASLVLAVAIMGGFIFQFPIGYLADHFNRRSVLLTLVVISMACCMLLPMAFDQGMFVVVLILTTITSGIIASFYPLGVSEAFDRLVQNDMGRAIGAMIIVYAFGGMVGPYTTGLFMSLAGNDVFFSVLAIIHAAFAIFIAYRSFVRSSIPLEEQEPFVPQGASGWVSNDLDPRTEHEEEARPLGEVARTITGMAESRPELALEMVGLVAKSMPSELPEVVAAVAAVKGVDGVAIYDLLRKFAPDQQQELTPILIAAVPGQSAELVNAVFEDANSDEIVDLAVDLADASPEHGLEIIQAAADVVQEDNPDAVVDIAEAYLCQVADHLGEMRYADRLVDGSDKTVDEVVEMVAEKVPDRVTEFALAAVETVPASSSYRVKEIADGSAHVSAMVTQKRHRQR